MNATAPTTSSTQDAPTRVAEQIEAAKQAALAVPEVDLATLVITGGDRVSWLNGLVTCDLTKRRADAAVYGLAVARNGRVLADVIVVFDEAGARLLVAAARAVVETLRAHLDHYLVMEDAELTVATEGFEAWSLHGPASAFALDAAMAVGAIGGTLDRTGLGGAFFFVPAGRAAEVRAALAAAATRGDAEGWNALRIERGVPLFGVDFDDKTYPQEAGLERTAISFDKGCYLGQEVVCMLELRGHVKRKLASVVLDAQEPPAAGAVVTDDGGTAVGEVTSAIASPTLGRGKAIALAMVKRAQAEPGQGLVVGGARGEVVARPV